ncbi:hypothetical protein PMAYCL1PPCAC_13130, partial [Pristionchus mayeri]
SKFVIRWEIDNVDEVHNACKAESEVFNEKGFKWRAGLRNADFGTSEILVQCGVDHSDPWGCDVDVERRLITAHGTFKFVKQSFSFNQNNLVLIDRINIEWDDLTCPVRTCGHEVFIVNDKITLEFHINIYRSEGSTSIADPGIFASPNDLSNVILKIGGRRLHVSKEYLSIHSSVFKSLFFGNFNERGKDEVEINDVVYEEFLDILHLIYPRTVHITNGKVLHVLKLADRFNMGCLMREAERFLANSIEFDVMKKLLIADQYRLTSLKEVCLNSFPSVSRVVENLKSPEFDNFSGEMKAEICERMAKLARSSFL